MSSSVPTPEPAQTVAPVDKTGRTSRNSRLMTAAGYRQNILTDLVSQYGGGTRLGA